MTSSEETRADPARRDEVSRRAGTLLEGEHRGAGLRIGIVAARFNDGITLRLLEGCLDALFEMGVGRSDVVLAWVPGAFEIPVAAQALAASEPAIDAVVCLGAVIRGETGHYDQVAGECARGIQDVALEAGIPVIFGVLTCETVGQALERSAPDETNKGRESAETAVEMVRLLADPRIR